MTIERKLGIFDINKVLINRYITSDHVRDAFAAINYLYEALGSEAVPNGGTEEIAGHDHADLGGAPIPRGGVGTWSGGRNPLFTCTPTSNWGYIDSSGTQYHDINTASSGVLDAHRLVYASPGIDTLTYNVYLPVTLRYFWDEDSEFNVKLRFSNPDFVVDKPWLRARFKNYVELEIEPHADMQESTILFPVVGDYWNRMVIEMLALGGEAPYSTNLKLYDIVSHETVADSQPKTRGYMRFA